MTCEDGGREKKSSLQVPYSGKNRPLPVVQSLRFERTHILLFRNVKNPKGKLYALFSVRFLHGYPFGPRTERNEVRIKN